MKANNRTGARPNHAGKRKAATQTSTTKTNTAAAKRDLNPDSSMLMHFFETELKDLYWAEQHLSKEYGKMAEKANSVELQEVLVEHQSESEEHVERIERIFNMLGTKVASRKCEAIAGITKEVHAIVSDTEDDTFTRDVAIIVGVQKIEHYEIATYGSLVQLARTMHRSDIADVLSETLEEEKNVDRLLTHIAEATVNEEATTETEAAEEE